MHAGLPAEVWANQRISKARKKEEEGVQIVTPPPPPPPPTHVYQHVTIETGVDWRQWYDFYRAVIQPLAEAGAEVRLRLRLEASGEVDANLVDLSVKESVLQFNPQGKVDVEE
jgi:hypothetical protein